jgi:dephospho-CoA kinase
MLRVGLTGNIGSGKSVVAESWRRLGAQVVDADRLAREAVAPGSPALARIAEVFGADVMQPDGGLDRAAVRRRVFRDAAARRRLEGIVHPEVERLRAAEERRLKAAGADIVVFEIPLLFEAGLQHRVDLIVLVDAPAAERLRRVMTQRGLDRAQAEAMAAAQMPAAAKRPRADIIIENRGTLQELESEAGRVWKELKRRAGSA